MAHAKEVLELPGALPGAASPAPDSCHKWLHCCLPFHRDVDETISWIKEKEQLMASDDFGRDLASVQALLRKHEGLERDLAALEDKVGFESSQCHK